MRDRYEAVMVIANWPETRAEQWETLLKARAMQENRAYVIAVNRVGDGDGLHYIPGSHVYDWLGRDISVRVSEKLRVADIDSGGVETGQEQNFHRQMTERIHFIRRFIDEMCLQSVESA